MLTLLLACADPTDPTTSATTTEPDGAVGVRTETLSSGLKVEVWYPSVASDAPTEDVDYSEFIPPAVTELLGPIELPTLPSRAVRDADLDLASGPHPLIVFSHGFGGMRVQSVDLTTNLAAAGYVVIATDHAGRSLPDLLPCLFIPALEGCNLGFDDPGPDDVAEMVDWLAAPPAWLAGGVDLERLGITGHSAGAGTTVTVGNTDDRFDLVMPLAGGAVVTRTVATLRMAGTCDGIVPASGTNAAFAKGQASEVNVEVLGAGHLAFSDLCTLDLAGLGADLLADRPDVNGFFLEQLTQLGSDGCPGSPPLPDLEGCDATTYLDLETSAEIVRVYTLAAADAALGGGGPGAQADLFPEARVTFGE